MTYSPRVLVSISGAPGSGKSTLASALAERIGVPRFSRDDLREVLLDSLGADDRPASRRIGRAAFTLISSIAARFAAVSCGVVIESNFRRRVSEPELQPLVTRMPSILLHCQTSSDEIVRRSRERDQRAERHPGHFDRDAITDLIRDLESGRYEPLDLDIPVLRIDTTDGYRPNLDEITRLISADDTVASSD